MGEPCPQRRMPEPPSDITVSEGCAPRNDPCRRRGTERGACISGVHDSGPTAHTIRRRVPVTGAADLAHASVTLEASPSLDSAQSNAQLIALRTASPLCTRPRAAALREPENEPSRPTGTLRPTATSCTAWRKPLGPHSPADQRRQRPQAPSPGREHSLPGPKYLARPPRHPQRRKLYSAR